MPYKFLTIIFSKKLRYHAVKVFWGGIYKTSYDNFMKILQIGCVDSNKPTLKDLLSKPF